MTDPEQWWIPEMTALGYTDDLPRPCNVAIQATLASISAPEIHTVIQEHEHDSLYSQSGDETGQFLMLLLGIEEWFAVYLIAETQGPVTALSKLEDLTSTLPLLVEDDAIELENANDRISAILSALLRAEDASKPRPNTPGFSGAASSASSSVVSSSQSAISSATPADAPVGLSPVESCSRLLGNPLRNLRWLTAVEKKHFVVHATPSISPSTSATSVGFTGEPFIPALPARHLEYEVSAFDGAIRRIPNINNLSPLSLEMWMAWGSVSKDEMLECRRSALLGFARSDKPPAFVCKWPLTTFGAKYKCTVPANARIRGSLVTTSQRIADHKSKLWNWLRPFFRCSCQFIAYGACGGQILWFDHAVWYILTHLQDFFNAESIQGRLVLFIEFLSGEAHKMVLDHISFILIRQFMLDGAMELVEHPDQPFFTNLASTRTLRIVEQLFKPSSFSEQIEREAEANKHRINLNKDDPLTKKAKGMYVNMVTEKGNCNGQGRASRGRGATIRNVCPGLLAGRHAQPFPALHKQIGEPAIAPAPTRGAVAPQPMTSTFRVPCPSPNVDFDFRFAASKQTVAPLVPVARPTKGGSGLAHRYIPDRQHPISPAAPPAFDSPHWMDPVLAPRAPLVDLLVLPALQTKIRRVGMPAPLPTQALVEPRSLSKVPCGNTSKCALVKTNLQRHTPATACDPHGDDPELEIVSMSDCLVVDMSQDTPPKGTPLWLNIGRDASPLLRQNLTRKFI